MQSGSKKSKGRRCTPNQPNRRAAPDTGAPVVNNYSAVREVAADEMGIEYGEVYVGAFGSAIRSHELAPGSDKDSFIPNSQTYAEREARRRNAAEWVNKGRESNEIERYCPRDDEAGETG